MRDRIAALVVFLGAILIIVIGLEGSLGKVLACLLTPSEMVINSG